MTQALKHIRPILLAIAGLVMLCAPASVAFAQVPSGTRIENQAHGHFRFKTGARDTVRSNTVQTVVSSTEGPFLSIEKSVDLSSVAPGANLIYTLIIRNEGTSPATSLRLVDTLPANTTFVSASDGGALQGPAAVWSFGSLPASGTTTFTMVVRVNPAFMNGTIDNRAHVSSQQGISAASNLVRSTVTTYIATGLELSATKDAIIGNGLDTTTLGALVTDAAGIRAEDGTRVLFTTTRGRFSNGSDSIAATTLGGVASAILRSDVVVNETPVAEIVATTLSASGETVRGVGSITFYSGAIAGTIFSTGTGLPIVGADAFALDAAGTEVSRDTTDSAGYYLLPVADRGDYTVVIRYTNRHGVVIETSSTVNVDAPVGSGGSSPTTATSSISGTVIDSRTGAPLRSEVVPVNIGPYGFGKSSGRTSSSATAMTDANGSFTFDSLALGQYTIRIDGDEYQGSIDILEMVPGRMVIDSDIEASEIPRLQVTVTSTKRIAEIGDVVGYTVETTNASRSVHLDNILISSALPPGFAYVPGTSRLDGKTIGDPSGSRTLLWQLPDTLAAGTASTLSYRAVAAAGAIDGNGITRVIAMATSLGGDSARSLAAEAIVDVRPGVFTDRGIVIGKIYYDADSNGYQDPGEEGIAGVELWMEDGTRIVTGEEGRYSLPQVRAGERVIRVNRATLPTGSRLVAGGTAFAGDALSRFVRITEGSIVRADFHLMRPTQAALGTTIGRQSLSAIGDSTSVRFIVRIDDATKTKRIVLNDTLPAGLHYDMTSLRLNGVAVKTETRRSQTLSVQLSGIGGGDTVTVAIVADSAGVDRMIGRRGVLILSYPKGRDALFRADESGLVPSGSQGSVLRYEPRRHYTMYGSMRRMRGATI